MQFTNVTVEGIQGLLFFTYCLKDKETLLREKQAIHTLYIDNIEVKSNL